MKRIMFFAAAVLVVPLIFGCATSSTNLSGRYSKEGAVVNWTGASEELKKMPKPAQKIAVAVWKLPDETGQHRRSANATELSKAVTQGGVHMLIKALMDSGWFEVVERESWANIAQELKIREEMVRQGVKDVNGGLSHLKVPRYLIAGAITEYEHQPFSGGAGVGYRGFGLSGRMKIASVATDLRLTDIETGVVKIPVSIYKRIASEEVDFSIFRFIKIDKLLEVETGFTSNEPTQACVRESIEKAVINIIANGVKMGLWKPADPAAMKYFTEYKDEKDLAEAKEVKKEVASGQAKPKTKIVFGKEVPE
ncbi:MAG: CsgG/HfaB family protein [archaeon]